MPYTNNHIRHHRRAINRALFDLRASVDRSETRTWQILTIMTPILLTALFTFITDRQKAAIEETIKARFTLTEELYKRELDVSEKLAAQVIEVMNKLKQAEQTKERGAAIDSVKLLIQTSQEKRLYLTEATFNEIDEFTSSALRVRAIYDGGNESLDDLDRRAMRIENQLVNDLAIPEIRKLPTT